MCKPSKLSHLTNEQIEVLYQRYINQEKISELIKEYSINTSPHKFISCFPLEESQSLQCPYCGDSMFRRRAARNSIASNNSSWKCIECSHYYTTTGASTRYKSCQCTGCLKEAEAARQALNDEKLSFLNNYAQAFRNEKIHVSELTIAEKILVLSLLRLNRPSSRNILYPLHNKPRSISVNISPSSEMDQEILEHLLNRGLILIIPELSTDACLTDDNGNIDIDYRMAAFQLNVRLDNGQLASGHELLIWINKNILTISDKDILLGTSHLNKKSSAEAVLQYAKPLFIKRKMPMSCESALRDAISNILDHITINDALYCIRYSLRHAVDFHESGGAKNKYHASNTVPRRLISAKNMLIENNFIKHTNHIKDLPSCIIRETIFEKILRNRISPLNIVFGDFIPLTELETENEEIKKYYGVHCVVCLARDCSVSMHEKHIIVTCNKCNSKRVFNMTP